MNMFVAIFANLGLFGRIEPAEDYITLTVNLTIGDDAVDCDVPGLSLQLFYFLKIMRYTDQQWAFEVLVSVVAGKCPVVKPAAHPQSV